MASRDYDICHKIVVFGEGGNEERCLVDRLCGITDTSVESDYFPDNTPDKFVSYDMSNEQGQSKKIQFQLSTHNVSDRFASIESSNLSGMSTGLICIDASKELDIATYVLLESIALAHRANIENSNLHIVIINSEKARSTFTSFIENQVKANNLHIVTVDIRKDSNRKDDLLGEICEKLPILQKKLNQKQSPEIERGELTKEDVIERLRVSGNKTHFHEEAHASIDMINTHRNKLGKFSIFNIGKNLREGVAWDSTTSMRRLLREGREAHGLSEKTIKSTVPRTDNNK